MPQEYPDYCDRCESIDESFNYIVIGEIDGESVCDVCRTEEIRDTTFLSEREAKVVALKELTGGTHQDVADSMNGVKKSTVDEYSRRANKKLERAKRTVEYLE